MAGLGDTLVRYGLVGAFNTLLTLVVISGLTIAGFNLIFANAVGFAAGLCSSYIGNRNFTFKQRQSKAIMPFLAGFAISYAANILMVLSISKILQPHDLISQLIGMLTYNVVFFVLMKTWIFNRA